MAFAAAVNAELKALKGAGADVVQIDEPYLQARPEKARHYALPAINAALRDLPGPVALHTCFGYAHIVHNRPNGYPFLEPLADTRARQISMESAQQNVDLGVLKSLAGKDVIVGVIDLADNSAVESVETVVNRIRNALRYVDAERLVVAPDCGMKYLPRDKAFGKLRAMVAGAEKVRAEL
jgi:5-methyltetrahydropteroyltriglutamate--homocysteine methyltransferase